jgi:hypothetical protein
MGTSDQRSSRGAAGLTDMISGRSSFSSRLEPKSPSPEDDIDGLRSILELWVVPLVPLVIIFGFLVHGLLVLLATVGIAESPSDVITINCRMICDSSRTCNLGTLFVSVKYVLVSVKLVCV